MAFANNPLLTALTAAKAQNAAANTAVKAAQPAKDGAASFSHVFAKQTVAKPFSVDDSPAKPASAKSSATDNKQGVNSSSAADDKTVAANGNGLPDKKVQGKNDDNRASADDDSAQHEATDSTVVDASTPGSTTEVVSPATTPAVEPSSEADPALMANAASLLPQPIVDAAAEDQAQSDTPFDPSADPLEGLTAVQIALDNKAQRSAQNSAGMTHTDKNSARQEADPAQLQAGNLAALGDQLLDQDATESGGEKAFGGLLADGLKDLKGAASDTRVDNFADRLAALSQAAQAKPATASAAALLNQPLAMNQSGWTEGVVNRVMYLSSQSLKQADIQLEPAELGRLDIRVNMAADQATQVTFMSAHVGVREALESQMSRLRESFVQQGMGQVDVNVSDQNRGWQQQAQQQSGSDGQGGGSNSARGSSGGELIADGAPVDAASAAASAPLTVVGSSAVDYYA